ncbi:MAG TPA: malto-oligosyltrehalose trehalohydrolase [Gemmatimonadaceae bacterium]|jgi:maltooligosyltrehalose trehalohydrolase|nr:malto-oligosyltrehalose trehalohydrolase [Gemmatimonadaceae bacterium]
MPSSTSKPTGLPLSIRRYPIGVEFLHRSSGPPQGHARVWAPECRLVELVTKDDSGAAIDSPLDSEGNGYFSGFIQNVLPGTKYRFRLDNGDAFPDPASRFQPEGPHGPSVMIDPTTFVWHDDGWQGIHLADQVLYELHVGTFTHEGTFAAAIDRLGDLSDVGVTTIEVMPVGEFPGRFGWGYDGVNLFAPSHLYGTPDDFRAFVDAAHQTGLGVILDVVYNHLGPDGNYLPRFSSRYLSGKRTEWGDALNFDGEDSAPVREFFTTNARYWIEEFHLDGLRLDATQQIFDQSSPHIIADVAAAVRAAAGDKATIVVGENEPQDVMLLRPREEGGCALDGLWNDDFHHSAWVAATGRAEAYYCGYHGSPQEFISAAKYGFLFQGEWYAWQHDRRGTPALDVSPERLIVFTQNHDQVANTARGHRVHRETSPARCRALAALLLLPPQTPMLFQGQEFAASSPFLYFADHKPELARLVRQGRAEFVSQFASIGSEPAEARVPDPSDIETFRRCKLDWSERSSHREAVALHRDLIRLRREDATLSRRTAGQLDGAVLADHAFALRFFGVGGDDRLLIVNLGPRLRPETIPEPLLAPPANRCWTMCFSTESPEYGGWGTPHVETERHGWWIPAESAVLLRPA